MGQVDEDGRGKIAPHHFVMAFKTKNQKGLNVLKNKRCWVPVALRISAGDRCAWGSIAWAVDGNDQAKKKNYLHLNNTSTKHKANLDAEMLAQNKNRHDTPS